MAMLKKLKSLFIIEEEVPKSTSTGNIQKGKPRINPKNADVIPPAEVEEIPVNEDVKAPDKFINSLLGAIENNNLEGFDYLEYKQSLKSLEGMELDEETRFNSAFAMAKTMGATKENLLSSANHYINILNEEKSKFNTAYEKQQQKQVQDREEKLINLENSIKKKEEQIKKLQEEIKSAKAEFEKKKKEINSAAAKVALTRDQFFAAHKKVNDQIEIDIERMNKYLTK